MLNIRVVQEYATDKVSGSARLIRETPYIRFRYSQEPPVFVQQGTFYYEDSTVIPAQKLPEWVIDSVAQLTPETLQSVGLDLGPRPVVPSLSPPILHEVDTVTREQELSEHLVLQPEADLGSVKMFASDWECEECGERVAKTAKGLHIARHRRKAKFEERHGNSPR